MKMGLFFVAVLVGLTGCAVANISGTNPVNGACLCFSDTGVNVRSTACGTVIGSANSGQCYTYLGTKTSCALSGVTYDFFKFNWGGQTGWAAGTYLNTDVASKCTGGSGAFTDKCMKCICQIESGCNANIGCVSDVGSLSCGPYQIKQAYYTDCGSPGSGYQPCTTTLSCSETCVKANMKRYGTYCTGGRAPTCQDYARIHNGGPNGCTSSATVAYWTKVESCCGSQTGCD